jgi:hypothetical protein
MNVRGGAEDENQPQATSKGTDLQICRFALFISLKQRALSLSLQGADCRYILMRGDEDWRRPCPILNCKLWPLQKPSEARADHARRGLRTNSDFECVRACVYVIYRITFPIWKIYHQSVFSVIRLLIAYDFIICGEAHNFTKFYIAFSVVGFIPRNEVQYEEQIR